MGKEGWGKTPDVLQCDVIPPLEKRKKKGLMMKAGARAQAVHIFNGKKKRRKGGKRGGGTDFSVYEVFSVGRLVFIFFGGEKRREGKGKEGERY